MACFDKKGLEIKRSTCCLASHFADIVIDYPEVVPLGRLTHLYLKIKWKKEGNDTESIVKFQSIPGGGEVLFNGAGGTAERKFTGSVELKAAIYGKTQSGSDKADVALVVEIREKSRVNLEIKVATTFAPSDQDAIKALTDELVTAATTTRPADPAGMIWDRYDQIFKDATAIAAALVAANEPGQVSVPVLGGEPENRTIPLQELRDHIKAGRDINGPAARKARIRKYAFDLFEGKWRGHWRQRQHCGEEKNQVNHQNTCQDHHWQGTAPVAGNSPIWVQPVVMGADSREYAENPEKNCLEQDAGGRDFNDYAINMVDTVTGNIFGATSLMEKPGSDGVRSARPHIGFYVDYNKLIWVAEEYRDGNEALYSVFYEIGEADDNDAPIYTILGFDFKWKNGAIEGEINTKGGQYRKYLADAELELEQLFNRRELNQDHLAPERRYRRRLESMGPAEIQQFLDKATPGNIQDYLKKVLDFVRQRKALEEAVPGPRQKVTFLTGELDDDYFAAANSFFQLNPSGTTVPWQDMGAGNVQSLADIKQFLLDNAPADVPWGQINIVAHANASGRMIVPLFDADAVTDLTFLTEAIDNGRFLALRDEHIDSLSEIYIRGCEIGENQTFLSELSRGFAGSDADDLQRPTARAPKLIQTYFHHHRIFDDGERLDGAEESLTQKWFVIQPNDVAFNRNAVTTLFENKYGAAYPHVDWHTALGRTTPRYNGDFFHAIDEDVTFTYGNRLADPASPPPVGTPAEQRAYLEADAGLNAWLTGMGLTLDHFHWTFRQDGDVLYSAGNCDKISVKRDVLADLEDLFNLNLDRQDDLTNHRLSEELLAAFSDAGHPLSEQTEILILWNNNRWLIKDRAGPVTYAIFRTPDHLVVRRETSRPIEEVSTPDDAAQIQTHLDSVNRSLPAQLFQTNTGPAGDLDQNHISGQLVGTFATRGFPFDQNSGDVTIRVIDAGRVWRIYDNDNGREFVILRAGGNLNVHFQQFRAHPPATTERFFGSHVPVNLNPLPPGENVTFP